MLSTRKPSKGFTLLELVFTLAIIAVILGIGVPAFSEVISNSKRKDTVYQLLGMLNFARDSAVNTSSNVVICASKSGLNCLNSNNWANSLLVFIDKNKNNDLDEDELLLRKFNYENTSASLTWKSFGRKPWLSFHADGSSGFQSGRIYYCQNEDSDTEDKAQIILYRTGRARIASPEEFKAGC